MDTFVIQGGRKLTGSIRVMGAKNAAGPILAATTLVGGVCNLHNIPRILDVIKMIDILKSMGAKIEWSGEHSLSVDSTRLDATKIDHKLIAQIRMSVLLLGCLSQRFGEVTISVPGGCNIGSRPLDAHFTALSDLGYDCSVSENSYTIRKVREPRSSVVMRESSVTATENAILASVLGGRDITLHCCAIEPVVQDLCWFLNAAGARIGNVGHHTITIDTVTELHGTDHTIVPDPIEAGTLMVLAGATHSEFRIDGVAPDFLRLEFSMFEKCGIGLHCENTTIGPGGHYSIASVTPVKTQLLASLKKLHCMPYPGIAADLIQPFALLLTQAQGISLVHDWMYDSRQRYVSELVKMGANITVLDPHRIMVLGPTPLHGTDITSYDLRAGATLVIAGLIADGETTIHDAHQVDRGYERLDERLRQMGAKITRT